VLLGAGASCDAGLKNSFQMISDIEDQLKTRWSKYEALYNYVQSSHHHLERIKGVRLRDIIFNIENLVGLLNVIINIADKNVEVYPFIGSWEKELSTVAGPNFELAKRFREEILSQLKTTWLMPDDFRTKSSYYRKLSETGYNYPLRIFTLNYDICVESNIPATALERGFTDERKWDYRRYESSDRDVSYFLYKLHGSLDWKRDSEKRLTFSDFTDSVNPLEMEIIFGTQNKLQSYDPFMFYFYAFREACINAELIVTSGYGFYDAHINENIKNALRLNPNKHLLVNVFEHTNGLLKNDDAIQREIADRVGIAPEAVSVMNMSARQFFNDFLNVNYFASLFPTIDAESDVLPSEHARQDNPSAEL